MNHPLGCVVSDFVLLYFLNRRLDISIAPLEIKRPLKNMRSEEGMNAKLRSPSVDRATSKITHQDRFDAAIISRPESPPIRSDEHFLNPLLNLAIVSSREILEIRSRRTKTQGRRIVSESSMNPAIRTNRETPNNNRAFTIEVIHSASRCKCQQVCQVPYILTPDHTTCQGDT